MKHGSVVRGWLGVQIQSVDAGHCRQPRPQDSRKAPSSARSSDGSPAAKAGFKVGDAITAVNGQPIKDSRDLALRISEMNPGTKVTVTYWRDGASHDVDVTLGTLPDTDQMASSRPGQQPAPAGAAVDAQGLRPDAEPRRNNQTAAS